MTTVNIEEPKETSPVYGSQIACGQYFFAAFGIKCEKNLYFKATPDIIILLTPPCPERTYGPTSQFYNYTPVREITIKTVI